MLATTTVSLHSFTLSRSCPPSSSRQALADSTNINTRSDAFGPSPKRFVYPTSSIRTGCGCSEIVELPVTSVSIPLQSRPHHFSASSPFPVTYKAPPTVSISLSAACSQSILGEQFYGSGTQGPEPDLPDVKSVVPFPTQLNGNVDVEMLDETCVLGSNGCLPPADQVPRKRRSAHSSVICSPGGLGKDAKPKRPRKSKRQVAELWWLGVIHRSISRAIEARQPSAELSSSDRLLSGRQDFDALDRALVEQLQKRLAGNGCVEGRLPSPLPRISSPSVSAPSLNLPAPSKKPSDSAPPARSSEQEKGTLNQTAITLPAPKASPRTLLSVTSCSSTLSPAATTSRRRHVHFEITPRPPHAQSRPNILRRSPSPPARTGTVPSNPQTLTLTLPQLVASLTLAYRERSRPGLRGRTCRPPEYEKNTGRPLSSEPCLVAEDDSGDVIQDNKRMEQSFTALRARLTSAPERKSPLSHVAYAEG